MKLTFRSLVATLAVLISPTLLAEAPKPLKALLVIGGCCHDYAVQKDLIKVGLEQRLNMKVDVCYSDAKNTRPEFECYQKDDWAAGYDVIIHDECAADVKDMALLNRILAPHRNGLPGVNIHCAMHSFRVADDFKSPKEVGDPGGAWFEYLGIHSTGHGPKKPVEVNYTKDASPITKGFENWTTGNEELYNNIKVYPGITELAKGKQMNQETVVIWKHLYGEKKTKVFSTTLGHFNETVSDERYMNLIARGLLWACGKLGDDGQPAEGYWIAK